MDNRNSILTDTLPDQAIFALDIGTRSIIGMVGMPDGERIHIVAIERAEHTKRAMIDGQIEDIEQVAKIAGQVKDRLERKLGCKLQKVCVAAAGRALRTESITYEMELSRAQKIDAESVSRLEAGAISEAEKLFMNREGKDSDRQFYLVGYTVSRYYLDNYVISNLIDHHGKVLKADIIATFLPTEVVESLYSAMHKIDLEVASLTLEPIAAINAAIPQNIRLLNLAMVDIGAGTSDIAVCRDGSVTGYTMAILAGDEITESVMKEYLVDFDTAEKIKAEIDEKEEIQFTDILGFEQTITRDSIFQSIKEASSRLCEEISEKILEINGGMPSAVFLAGGGSRLSGLKEGIVEHLKIDTKRVAIAGNNFKINAFSEEYDLENPEYATPLGIVISAGFNIINDSFRVVLNDRPAKIFRSGSFTVMDVLMMNGYNYQDMIGRSGQNLVVSVNGKRTIFYGEKAEPSVLKLNGEEAQLSDPVNSEDWIVFVPATSGKSAAAKLSDITELSPNKLILINEKKVVSDVAIKPGDNIIIEENIMEEIEVESDYYLDEEETEEFLDSYELEEQDEISVRHTEPISKPSNGIHLAPAEMRVASIDLDPFSETQKKQQEIRGDLTVFLNDKPLILPPKPDNQPYYLMDVLEYSGLDFKNLTRQVMLEINGESGAFQQELHSRDNIKIYQV
jgi:cell division protein FtsA